MTKRHGGVVVALLCLAAATACDVNAALEQLSEARQASADLLVQFTKAADASNKAVLADTDEASVTFAKESEQAKERVQADVDGLKPRLERLKFANETGLLQQFVAQFAQYRELDRRILDLAVENTNLKAQRLSFGPAQDSANAFRDALRQLVPLAPGEKWHVEALSAQAIATVREIQVLQAPHIADADEAVMTRMETSMVSSEAAARDALRALAPLVQPASRARLMSADAALDRFVMLNREIISLSRRNTNVRSLALSLNEKQKVVTACEQALHALRDALAKRGYTGVRLSL